VRQKMTLIGFLAVALSTTMLFTVLGKWRLGYAFQWFASALTVVVLTLVVRLGSDKTGTP